MSTPKPKPLRRADVLAVVGVAGPLGATDAEIEAVTKARAQSVTPRRGELRDRGFIVDSGRRRLTPRGFPAIVWTLPKYAPGATKPGGEP